MTIRSPGLRAPSTRWLLLLPALTLLAAVLLVPLAQSLLRSIGQPDWTTEHYSTLFTDGVTMRVLLRTVKTAAIVTAVAFALGYPYAYLMTRVGPRARGVMLVVVLVPFWTSVMARNFAWIVILQRGGPSTPSSSCSASTSSSTAPSPGSPSR